MLASQAYFLTLRTIGVHEKTYIGCTNHQCKKTQRHRSSLKTRIPVILVRERCKRDDEGVNSIPLMSKTLDVSLSSACCQTLSGSGRKQLKCFSSEPLLEPNGTVDQPCLFFAATKMASTSSLSMIFITGHSQMHYQSGSTLQVPEPEHTQSRTLRHSASVVGENIFSHPVCS